MGTLSYTATMSVDGFVADASGDFQWSGPSDESFLFHIERLKGISTEVLGRKTYLLMRYWEAEPEGENWGELEHEFARRWQGLQRFVASTTLSEGDLADRDRLIAHLDLADLARIAEEASGEVEVFGPTTAAAAIRAGIMRDFRFFVVPKVIGSGLKAMPEDTRLDLQLVTHRIFSDGTAYLHYRAR